MTLDEAIRQARGALAQPPDREIPGVRVVEADALQALVDHAQAGKVLAAQGVPLPLARGESPEALTLRDLFAMHAPWQGVEQFYVYATGPNERVRLVAARWAYADAMMAARGAK